MPARTNLDMAVLRSFVAGFDLGSFARAAQRLGLSQSAVSTQLRKLEDQVGEKLVQKSGRALALTAAGESLLSFARRILELNDEAVDTIRGADVDGAVRLGLPQDFAENWLPEVLGRFARAHPRIRVEVQVDRSAPLIEAIIRGALDTAIVWGDVGAAPRAAPVADLPIAWIGRPGWPGLENLAGAPLPLAVFVPPCVFRTAGVNALDAAGISWRVAFTSPSLAGLWAATTSGLGLTVRTTFGLPPALVALDPAASGLPALPAMRLSLLRGEATPGPAAERLTGILLDTIRDLLQPDTGARR